MIASAQEKEIAPPDLNPVPATPEQSQLVDEGIVLHDQGDYDGAIAKYQEAIEQNPTYALAFYEMGMSYFSKNDYRNCLEAGLRGARYKSNQLPLLYMLIANSYDVLGEPQKAVKVYEAGIDLMPDLAILHFNLAVTYINQQKIDAGKASLKTALQLDPNHPGSHLALATLFQSTGHKTPALLATLRFLMLEPNSERSVRAYQLLQKILNGDVQKGDNPNETHITLNMSEDKEEGDFSAINMLVGLSGAMKMTEENKDKSELQLFVDQVTLILSVISETDSDADKSKFVWHFYAPYFNDLKKKNLVEPFCYYIAQQSKLEGVEEWLSNHSDAVSNLIDWSKEN
jgi:tetratricopeptide (TPR) repeat protein